MIIGAYLGAGLIVGVITYFIWRASLRAQNQTRAFLWGSTLLVLAGMATFILFSQWADIFTFGQTSDFSLPASYTAQGAIGWALLTWMAAGILSPFFVAIWARNRNG